MARTQATIVYWRDIPAQVIVKSGRKAAKRELSARFQEAIDRAAMRAGRSDTDAYLEDWRRGTPETCSDDLEHEATRRAELLEADYSLTRLSELVKNGGMEEPVS